MRHSTIPRYLLQKGIQIHLSFFIIYAHLLTQKKTSCLGRSARFDSFNMIFIVF